MFQVMYCLKAFTALVYICTNQVNGQSFLSGCGMDKGCFGVPPNCTANRSCNQVVTYRAESGSSPYVLFELATRLTNTLQSKYIAVGFSYDAAMGGDAVTACIYMAGAITPNVVLGYNMDNGKANTILPVMPQTAPTLVASGVTEGYMWCRFQQSIRLSNTQNGQIYRLDQSYYLLLAEGIPTSASNLSYHSSNRSVSPSQITPTFAPSVSQSTTPSTQGSAERIDLTTATIKDVRTAIISKQNSCRQLIEGYLTRIDMYNERGPALAAVISSNPNALTQAQALDNLFAQRGTVTGSLHCVPLLVKDNIDVAGMPTTNGVKAFSSQIPAISSNAVRLLTDAGAIVVGKANMSPFADKEAWGYSEFRSGPIRNPYGPNYTTYGSSGGNGAGIASGFAILGLGTETGVSINLPASAANLVGFRPPVSLIMTSSPGVDGVLPNCLFQDVVGLMARRAEDLIQGSSVLLPGVSVSTVTRMDGLRGMRFNVFPLFAYEEFDVPGKGHYKVDPRIQVLFNQMITNLQNSGAIVKNATINMTTAFPAVMNMFAVDYSACKVGWRDKYFSENPQRFPMPNSTIDPLFRNVSSVVKSGRLPPFYQALWQQDLNASNAILCVNQTAAFMTARMTFVNQVLLPLLNGADVALWPAMPEFPPLLGSDAFRGDWGSPTTPPVNLILAGSWAATASLTLPMGFSPPLPGAPDGLPIGVFMISGGTPTTTNLTSLLSAAYAYQETYGNKRVPRSVATNTTPAATPPPPRVPIAFDLGALFGNLGTLIGHLLQSFLGR